jgi:P-type conjugative transfer protein TrbJ
MSLELLRPTSKRSTLAAATVAAAIAVSMPRPAFALFGVGDVVFDPKNFAQHILILQKHADQLLQLKAQVEQMDRMLEGWDMSRVDETLAQMRKIHGTLDDIGTSLGDLDSRFPDDWTTADPHNADASLNPRLAEWRADQRLRAEQTVELHQAVADSIAETQDRVADYVRASNSAPGQLAAQQATNELLAVQVQQLQELQALEIAALRAELEQMAGRASAGDWRRANLEDDRTAAAAAKDVLDASAGPSGGRVSPTVRPSVGSYRNTLTGD